VAGSAWGCCWRATELLSNEPLPFRGHGRGYSDQLSSQNAVLNPLLLHSQRPGASLETRTHEAPLRTYGAPTTSQEPLRSL
jgi:hypothetical protein